MNDLTYGAKPEEGPEERAEAAEVEMRPKLGAGYRILLQLLNGSQEEQGPRTVTPFWHTLLKTMFGIWAKN